MGRFVVEWSKIAKSEGRVRWNAFIPGATGKTSVFRLSGLMDYEIWTLADQHVARLPERPVLGRADFAAQAAVEALLVIDPDDSPPRHASLTHWPAERSAQKLAAIKLAEASQLHLRPLEHPGELSVQDASR